MILQRNRLDNNCKKINICRWQRICCRYIWSRALTLTIPDPLSHTRGWISSVSAIFLLTTRKTNVNKLDNKFEEKNLQYSAKRYQKTLQTKINKQYPNLLIAWIQICSKSIARVLLSEDPSLIDKILKNNSLQTHRLSTMLFSRRKVQHSNYHEIRTKTNATNKSDHNNCIKA